jgi:hypothetical protein
MSFLFAETHKRTFWDVAGAHLPMALVTGLPLWLPYWLEIHRLPMRPCTFLSWTGHPCPFCGFTRAFWALAHGDWHAALTQTPLSGLVYLATALLFAWHGAALTIGVRVRLGSWVPLDRRRKRWAIAVVAFLFILNWAYRLFF